MALELTDANFDAQVLKRFVSILKKFKTILINLAQWLVCLLFQVKSAQAN